MKLFLQKIAKFLSAGGSAPRPPCLRRLGALLPNPRASGGIGIPNLRWNPIGLRRLGAPPPDPQKAFTLQISGYAPVRHKCTNKDLKLGLQSLVEKQANYSY